MKLSSLFKGKVYTFPRTQNQDEDKSFALEVIKRIKPNLQVLEITVGSIKNHYDVFILKDNFNRTFKLKISLDDSEGMLKKESNVVKNSKCPVMPLFIKYGQVKIGEEITYLLVEIPPYESVVDYGRSCIINNFDSFIDSYFTFQKTKGVRNTYRISLEYFLKHINPLSYLPEDSLRALKSYTDYESCENFISELSDEVVLLSESFKLPNKQKCHGGLSIESIFFDGEGFHFDDFKDVCMGHPYIDFIDLILDLGVSEDIQYSYLSIFCQKGGIIEDRDLFKSLYQIQLRKKLLFLITEYIKEVYVYDSYRYDNVLNIADVFSHCYERFCKIKIFQENREFIMKTICEPIFGVKA